MFPFNMEFNVFVHTSVKLNLLYEKSVTQIPPPQLHPIIGGT